ELVLEVLPHGTGRSQSTIQLTEHEVIMIRVLILGAALTVLAALGFCLERQSRPPAYSSVARLESGIIHASGRVEGATPEIALRSEICARIDEVCVREGDIVQAGDIVVRLDTSAAAQHVARMQAQSDL